MTMAWSVLEHPLFADERSRLSPKVSDKLDEVLLALSMAGPNLGRPLVDTLKGSRHANMKEIRFSEAKGVWRFAFAFDPERNAVILVGGEKQGVSQHRFYRELVREADRRFDDWLQSTD
jgi:hypothetical protein